MATCYQDNLIAFLRGIIMDLSEPYAYEDDRLLEIIMVAASIIIKDAHFATSYVISITGQTISPDPDNNFSVLTCLKAAAIIADGECRTASTSALSIKDGPSTIDGSNVAKNKCEIAKRRREDYDGALLKHNAGDGAVGRAIIGPYNYSDIITSIFS